MELGLAEKLKRAHATLLVAAGLACTAPVQAAIYQGAWDPAFGPAFADLGWRGEARFFVPNACLAESGLVFNSDSCSNFGMKILSAEVEFYKLSDPTNPAFQETLSFNVPSPFVDSMKIENGSLTGLFGTFNYFVPSTLALAGGPYTDFRLFFEDNLALMEFVSAPPGGSQTRGFSDRNAIITFRLVPEPGSMALAAVTLLLLVPLVRSRGASRVDRAEPARS
jgi:hypothetical protein